MVQKLPIEWDEDALARAGRKAFRHVVRSGVERKPGSSPGCPDRRNMITALKRRLKSERLLCQQESWADCPLRKAAILSHIAGLLAVSRVPPPDTHRSKPHHR